jgi:hypothetical protein
MRVGVAGHLQHHVPPTYRPRPGCRGVERDGLYQGP